MKEFCAHDDCKAEAIQELRWMGDVLRWGHDHLSSCERIVMRSLVPCRHVPSRGRTGTSPEAPLPASNNPSHSANLAQSGA